MKISYTQFMQAVTENDGEVLPTAGGHKTFRLELMAQGVCFIPTSSGKLRRLNHSSIQRYLDDFNESGSTITSDYSEIHRNQSYVLAIIKMIVSQRSTGTMMDDGTSTDAEIDPEFSAPEGELKVLAHRRRERRRELVQMAKAAFRAKHGRLFCEVCGFDFAKTYGEPDFIEVHHLIPLRDLKPGHTTKLSELAMVCPNCHRMLHRGTPWPTIAELKRRMAAHR